MTFSAKSRNQRGESRKPHGFTLVELMLVLALLAIVFAMGAPSLSRFFHGRDLDSEARRFLALTHYARSRATSEGVPMMLWFDTQQRTYGLKAEPGYVEDDAKAEQFQVNDTVEIEVEFSGDAIQANKSSQFTSEKQTGENITSIRFQPDGSIGETSPERVVFRQGQNSEVCVGESRNRLNYEIQANPSPIQH